MAQNRKDLRELRHLRKLAYDITIANYLDPKDIAKTEVAYWPLPGDPKPKPFNRNKFIKLHEKIMQLKFNGR